MPQAGFGHVMVRAQIQAITVLPVDLRIQVTDPLLRLVPHPLRRMRGRRRRAFGAAPLADFGLRQAREDRGLIPELRRNLDQCLVDQHRDRVQVGGMRLQPESLGFQRNCAAAGERIQDRGRIAVGRLEDLFVRLGQELLVPDVLPDDEALDDAVEPRPLALLVLLGRKLVRVTRGVVDELGEEDCASGSERPPGPPQVERRGMPVPDALLAG